MAPDAWTPEWAAATLGHPPRRVLEIGPRVRGPLPMFRDAQEVVVRTALDPETERGGPWDVVVLDGALERERWDRWMLQRLHRAMAGGAILLVIADHLWDLGSAAGFTYVASRGLRQVRRRLARRGAIPIADRSAFRGRRYAPQALAAMVAGVGFEVMEVTLAGHGWPRPVAALLGPLALRTASRVVLGAKRVPSLWGEGRPFPPAGSVESHFRSTHAAPLAERERWARQLGRTEPARPLDVPALAAGGVVVFSPHPDDEVIGCGGTLLEVASRGGAVTIVQVTDGSDSAAFITEPDAIRRRIRLDEAQRVAQGLGARELVCLRADNQDLRASAELAAAFRDVLVRTRPGTVFAPSFIDIHPDHQTVLRLLGMAMRDLPPPLPDVALYEVWSLVPHSVVHDVSRWMPRLEELLLEYETALKVDDYVHMVAERLLFHSLAHRRRPGYLEGFEMHSGPRFLELCETRFGSGTVKISVPGPVRG